VRTGNWHTSEREPLPVPRHDRYRARDQDRERGTGDNAGARRDPRGVGRRGVPTRPPGIARLIPKPITIFQSHGHIVCSSRATVNTPKGRAAQSPARSETAPQPPRSRPGPLRLRARSQRIGGSCPSASGAPRYAQADARTRAEVSTLLRGCLPPSERIRLRLRRGQRQRPEVHGASSRRRHAPLPLLLR
jgi:hypothetical protein